MKSGANHLPEPTVAVGKAMIVFNAAAGGVEEGDRDRLVDAVKAAGAESYALIDAEKLSRRLLARAKAFDVIIVLGGDGTARTAAALAPRDGPPLVLLPGGTMNILPRVLYGELNWPDALAAALEGGTVKRLPVGRANGNAFFIAGLFGAPTLLARAREAAREGRYVSAGKRVRHFVKRAFAHSLRARPRGGRLRRAEAIGALCPAFSGEIGGGTLEWVRMEADHMGDLARLGMAAITPAWRDDDAIDITKCAGGEILSTGVIPATLDGEPKTFLSRVRVTYTTKGPRVIALT